MIGHQQAAGGLNALKTTLQAPDASGDPAAVTASEANAASATQENGKEMEEVPKVNNPALEANEAVEAPEATEANGTANGEKDPEADEEDEGPIDMSFPKNEGWKRILVYLVSFPIMGPLFITLPDTKNEKKRKYFPITFFGSILWIAVYSYLMVWWAEVTGKCFGITEVVSSKFIEFVELTQVKKIH